MYDKIIRSKRKTFGLEVKENAEVILRLPWNARQGEVERFLQKNAKWIERTKKRIIEREADVPKTEFSRGTYLPHLGVSYPLEALIGPLYGEKGKRAFIAWSKKRARVVLQEAVKIHAKKAGRTYAGVRITSAKKRWGSCSGRGTLSFAWRLIAAPLSILNYVAAHEVAHLIHKNHGKRFWKKVEGLYPDYKKARVWIKNYGHLLAR